MTHGPNARPISSAVSAAITARKVMYWKTRKKPNSGDWVCSHWARLNSMGRALGIRRHQRGHHLFHLHEARRSEERRVGKECRSRCEADPSEHKEMPDLLV